MDDSTKRNGGIVSCYCLILFIAGIIMASASDDNAIIALGGVFIGASVLSCICGTCYYCLVIGAEAK